MKCTAIPPDRVEVMHSFQQGAPCRSLIRACLVLDFATAAANALPATETSDVSVVYVVTADDQGLGVPTETLDADSNRRNDAMHVYCAKRIVAEGGSALIVLSRADVTYSSLRPVL
jgi:hypothetical protein